MPCYFSVIDLVRDSFDIRLRTAPGILYGDSQAGRGREGPLKREEGAFRLPAFVERFSSCYDIDRGAEPDYVLTTPESFYDRAALTEYLNSLP